MKKLMVALTAVALGACAWAEGGETPTETPTLTDAVDFSSKPAGTLAVGGDTDWEYSGSDAAEALKIVGDEGSRVLEIKTGTAVLTRNVAKGGGAAAIGEGIYIDTVIDFQNQALDEVPTAANDEKLAIFVLDTTEIEGAPAGTNVYVMAGYGPTGKALYRLAGFDSSFIANGAHRVVVKSYANVIAGGNRTGFLVYIQKGSEATFTPCTVDLSNVYAIGADGAVTWTNVGSSSDYLGLTTGFQTTAAVARWVNTLNDSACLFLSMPTSDSLKQGNLSAVDFVGNAQIASVNVTATNPGFPADLFTMTLETNGVTVALVSGEGVALADGALTATADGVTVEVSVTLDKGMNMLTASANATKLDNGNWSFTFDNGGKVTFTGSQAAAYVGEFAYANIADAVNAFKGTAGATLRLAQATIWPAGDAAALAAANLTLDLAGQTLTLETVDSLLYVAEAGQLTITNSVDNGNGKIVGAGQVFNDGTLLIEKGIFDVEVVNDIEYVETATVAIKGGSFLKSCNSTKGETPAFTLAASVAQGLEVVTDGGYWKVQAAVEPETPTVEPGGDAVEVKAETAEAAADMVELQATSPDTSVVDNDTYLTYFTKQVTANGEGKFLVTAVLNDEIVRVDDVAAEVAANLGTVAAAAGDTTVEVTKAKAGLYYSVKYTADVANIATADEGDRVMATAKTVTIPMPKVTGSNKMFYRVQVSTAPKAQQ